jgi:hypothetical protein
VKACKTLRIQGLLDVQLLLLQNMLFVLPAAAAAPHSAC